MSEKDEQYVCGKSGLFSSLEIADDTTEQKRVRMWGISLGGVFARMSWVVGVCLPSGGGGGGGVSDFTTASCVPVSWSTIVL